MYRKIWWETLCGTDHLEDLGADGMAVLRWMFNEQDVRMQIGFIWRKIRTSGGWKHGN
jgi:hypothetical protein